MRRSVSVQHLNGAASTCNCGAQECAAVDSVVGFGSETLLTRKGQTAWPLRTPMRYELYNENWVTITLFDANHCPGAVMCVLSCFDSLSTQVGA